MANFVNVNFFCSVGATIGHPTEILVNHSGRPIVAPTKQKCPVSETVFKKINSFKNPAI